MHIERPFNTYLHPEPLPSPASRKIEGITLAAFGGISTLAGIGAIAEVFGGLSAAAAAIAPALLTALALISPPGWIAIASAALLIGVGCIIIAGVLLATKVAKEPEIDATDNLNQTAQIFASYPNATQEQINDFAYVDPNGHFLVAFDGAGHGKAEQAAEEIPIFKDFCRELSNNPTELDFTTEDAARLFVKEALTPISTQFCKIAENKADTSRYAPPACSLGLIATIAGEQKLLIAQADDCSLLIKRENGDFEWFPGGSWKGLGQPTGRRGEGFIPEPNIVDIAAGDEVFTFSDGIGEFLTQEEVEEVIRQNTDLKELLQNFYNAIIDPKKQEGDNERSKQRACANNENAFCRIYAPDDTGRHDDLCIASLLVT